MAEPDALAQQARFVFRGTVEAANASTMPDAVPPSDRTSIVHVDEVLQSPQSLAQAAGEQITVLLPEGQSVQAGEHMVFFTNPWLYGDTMAVQSVEQRSAPATLAAMTRRSQDPVRTLVDRDRVSRAADADLVLRGQVIAVRLVDDAADGRRAEHAPLWQDAVVRVTAVEKGNDPGPEVTIRFPASPDMAWRSAPKFTPGQEGRFVLRRAPAGGEERGIRAAVDAPAVYTALDRNDFQPAQELLSSEPPSTGRPT
jgi:hypothetical protein